MLCGPSISYRIWFWLLADALRTESDREEKSLHRNAILSFTSSRSPFWPQLESRETPHVSNLYTEGQYWQQRNRIDVGRPLTNVTPKRTDTLAIVERVQSHFFWASVAVRTTGHVGLTHFESPGVKTQRVPCEPPGERELGVVQEAQNRRPIPLGANLL